MKGSVTTVPPLITIALSALSIEEMVRPGEYEEELPLSFCHHLLHPDCFSFHTATGTPANGPQNNQSHNGALLIQATSLFTPRPLSNTPSISGQFSSDCWPTSYSASLRNVLYTSAPPYFWALSSLLIVGPWFHRNWMLCMICPY